VPGWSSLIISVIAYGAINLVCLGIIGEYIGRIFEQVKSRPLYLVGGDTRNDC
jgi:dolichol-phosphate mannosyltransferase